MISRGLRKEFGQVQFRAEAWYPNAVIPVDVPNGVVPFSDGYNSVRVFTTPRRTVVLDEETGRELATLTHRYHSYQLPGYAILRHIEE